MKLLLALILISLLTPCAANAEKTTLHRGWIGGEYKTAAKKLVPEQKRSAVYVDRIFPQTPAESAGLQPADLILDVAGKPIRNLAQFQRAIDLARPGNPIALRIQRGAETKDLSVIVGRESYQQWHGVQVGIFFSTKFDLWPDPNLSVPPILQFQRERNRVELKSPEIILNQTVDKKKQEEPGTLSQEGSKFWLVIFGWNSHKRVLAQEAVQALAVMNE